MPIHDWTRVESGIFHHFHGFWLAELCRVLNTGGLPPEYYALIDQQTGRAAPDVLALALPGPLPSPAESAAPGPSGTAVALAPPRVRFRERTAIPPTPRKRKSIVVRHVSDHRVVAMVEIVSPGNKGSRDEFRSFVDKAAGLLRAGIHLLVLDLLPPTRRDPRGIHRAIWSELAEPAFEPPADKPLTLASYVGGAEIEALVEPVAVGDTLPDMPLFVDPETYVPVALEAAYAAAWTAVPRPWREVLDPPPGPVVN